MNLLDRTDLTRSQIKRRFCRFTRCSSENNMTDTAQALRLKAIADKARKAERRNKTSGKAARFEIGDGIETFNAERNERTQRSTFREDVKAAPYGWDAAG